MLPVNHFSIDGSPQQQSWKWNPKKRETVGENPIKKGQKRIPVLNDIGVTPMRRPSSPMDKVNFKKPNQNNP